MAGAPEAALPGRATRVPDVGLRRVSWVRLVLGADRTRCQVAGLLHRRPVVLAIPLATATALIDSGVPAIVVGRQDAPPAVQPTAVQPPAGPPAVQLA
jgi:hypothetical protein